jgi:2,3-bisphosphoglycerate-independent phosphoglycerate mutase
MTKVILVVRDGWGYSQKIDGNAVRIAHTPNDNRYMKSYPWTLLKCTGKAVGVPEGTQGGSEPGHLTMGAGRIVWQPLEQINRSIRNEDFFRNHVLINTINYAKRTGGKLHLMGLQSDQGIHGTIYHLNALLELAHRKDFEKVYIHSFLDGRDVPEQSAKKYLKQTLENIESKSVGQIASIVGRYYAMDRDTNWDRTKKAYDLLTLGEGHKERYPIEAVTNAYDRGDPTDYYIEPISLIDENNSPIATMSDGDSVIFWNFRSDRARQITYALTQLNFEKFQRKKFPKLNFTCMSVYDKKLDLPIAYTQSDVKNNLGHILSFHGLKQLRIAETEKYAHVTFFFNSQMEEPNPGEDRILIPSPKVPNYEEKPEMSAPEINKRLILEIKKELYNFILVNYANGDLVGHSANLKAGIKAAETVDQCIGELEKIAIPHGYLILITGDHGNIETMYYPDGEPNPSHGLNPVPFIIISKDPSLKKIKLKENLGLSSIAPTILSLMGLEKPKEMTGENIIYK